MTIIASIFEFLRVSVAFALLFGVLPYLVSRPEAEDRLHRLIVSFVRSVLFVEVAAIILGSAQLCLTGSMLAAYALYIIATLYVSGKSRAVLDWNVWADWFHGLLLFLEEKRWRLSEKHLSEFDWSVLRHGGLVLLALLIIVAGLWYPAGNDRFQEIETYSRSLSLNVLTSGQPWQVDGSVAFLAPVVYVSGAPAVSVIRHSNVVLALLLALAAGYFVYRRTNRPGSAILAIGAAALCVQLQRISPEVAAAEIALVFWFLALGRGWRPLSDLYFALALALLISLTPDRRALFTAGVVVLIALVSPLFERIYHLFPRGAAPLLLGLTVLAQPLITQVQDGPHQYEAAAKAVRHIANQFPRNNWLVVSPFHETPFLYGRGWHVELSAFAEEYAPEQLADPGFEFGYEPDDVFIFVEKAPLSVASTPISNLQLMDELDASILAYNTNPARQSLQFHAGRLMAAYRSAHPETRTYYEDEDLIVYHVRPGEQKRSSASDALE